MDMNLSKLQELVEDREAWHAVVHGVTKSQTWLSVWMTGTPKGTSLVIQGLRLHASNAGGVDSISGWGSKIWHALWPKKLKLLKKNWWTPNSQEFILLGSSCQPMADGCFGTNPPPVASSAGWPGIVCFILFPSFPMRWDAGHPQW